MVIYAALKYLFSLENHTIYVQTSRALYQGNICEVEKYGFPFPSCILISVHVISLVPYSIDIIIRSLNIGAELHQPAMCDLEML